MCHGQRAATVEKKCSSKGNTTWPPSFSGLSGLYPAATPSSSDSPEPPVVSSTVRTPSASSSLHSHFTSYHSLPRAARLLHTYPDRSLSVLNQMNSYFASRAKARTVRPGLCCLLVGTGTRVFSSLPPLLECPQASWVSRQSNLAKADQVANSICLSPCSKPNSGGHARARKKGNETFCQLWAVNQSLKTKVLFLPTHLLSR